MSHSTRRHFLKQAAGTAMVAALSPWAGALAAGVPSDLTWQNFAKKLHGNLLRPGHPRYLEVYPPFNKRYLSIRPAAIALVRSLRDVRECIRFARDQGIPITARSGGHSYAGYCTTTGLVVDFRGLRAINLNASAATATLQPGARNRDIFQAFSRLGGGGFALPAGRCPTVAVSGLTLGGGFGFSSRHLGLTADRLISTDLVTADGEVLHCSARENPDLFWAMRGGGGGNFGINTRFEFQLEPVGNVSIYKVAWDFRDAAAVLDVMQKVIVSAPPEFSMRLGMGATGKTRAALDTSEEISMIGQYFGPSAQLREIIDPLVRAGRTTEITVADVDYWQSQAFFYKTAPVNRFGVKSHYVRQPISSAGLQKLVEGIRRRPGSSNPLGGGVTFFGWGGRINQVAPDATAFVHRDAILLLELDTGWTGQDAPQVGEANLEWLQTLSAQIRPDVSPFAYQNFIDPALKTWRSAYYGQNYDRLVTIKRRVDPQKFFRFAQGIDA